MSTGSPTLSTGSGTYRSLGGGDEGDGGFVSDDDDDCECEGVEDMRSMRTIPW